MPVLRRLIAAAELLLIFPAALFMTALFVRNLQPLQYEPARSAARIVTWYSLRPHVGLWVLLIALPLAVLVIGSATLLRGWRTDHELRDAAWRGLSLVRTHAATLVIAAATVTASGILAVVALHVLAD
jgi:hypothetical protein